MKRTSAKERRSAGFTLIELLAVVAVIFILMAMLAPAVQRARQSAQQTRCAHRIRQVFGLYQQRIADERRNRASLGWPHMDLYTWKGNLLFYGSMEGAIFRCPADPEFSGRRNYGSPGGHFFFAPPRRPGIPLSEAAQASDWARDFLRQQSADATWNFGLGNTSRTRLTREMQYVAHWVDEAGNYRVPPPPDEVTLEDMRWRLWFRTGSSVASIKVRVASVDPRDPKYVIDVYDVFSGGRVHYESGAGEMLWGRPDYDGGAVGEASVRRYDGLVVGSVDGKLPPLGYGDDPISASPNHNRYFEYFDFILPATASSFDINPEALGSGQTTQRIWVLRELEYWHRDTTRHVVYSDGSVGREPQP